MSGVLAADSARDVDAIARAIYREPIGPLDGVLHVVSIASEGRRVMRIGAHSPASATDRFVLDLARARAAAILVTGAILRAEPELRYELSPASAPGLLAWRREVAGLREPPLLVVLSRGDVPLSHPALASGWARPLVLTTHAAAARLRAESSIEIAAADAPSARAAIDHVRRERGCRAVSIEAGPTTAVPLYDPPCAIDELALSAFEGALDPRARGGAFLSERALGAAGLERAREPSRREEPSGPWRFERWIRRARRGTAASSR